MNNTECNFRSRILQSLRRRRSSSLSLSLSLGLIRPVIIGLITIRPLLYCARSSHMWRECGRRVTSCPSRSRPPSRTSCSLMGFRNDGVCHRALSGLCRVAEETCIACWDGGCWSRRCARRGRYLSCARTRCGGLRLRLVLVPGGVGVLLLPRCWVLLGTVILCGGLGLRLCTV